MQQALQAQDMAAQLDTGSQESDLTIVARAAAGKAHLSQATEVNSAMAAQQELTPRPPRRNQPAVKAATHTPVTTAPLTAPAAAAAAVVPPAAAAATGRMTRRQQRAAAEAAAAAHAEVAAAEAERRVRAILYVVVPQLLEKEAQRAANAVAAAARKAGQAAKQQAPTQPRVSGWRLLPCLSC